MDFLQTVSGILEVTDRAGLRTALQPAPSVSFEELLASFEGTDYAQTTAALRVIEELSEDDLLRARIRRTLRDRRRPLPAWLAHLDQTRVARVEFVGHVLGDGDDYLLDVRFAGAERATALVYVDHNMGGVVKDAFMVNEPIESVLSLIQQQADEGSVHREAEPALARATIENAVRLGAMYHPPFESDTWPLVRPLVLWLSSLLLAGGSAREPREWSDAELDEVAQQFLQSRWGPPYDDPDGRAVLEGLLWLAASYGPCDPLVWSAVRVEMIMADLFPRKVRVGRRAALRLPALLKDLVRFGHELRDIPSSLTPEVLAAVDHWRPVFEPELEAVKTTSFDEDLEDLLEEMRRDRLDWLELAVGGADALETLDAEMLPDEPFDWRGVPDDIAGKVGEILRMCDENAARFLDVEHRTANRRLLRGVVDGDPDFFRGRAGARTSAGAICWLVARANDSVGPYGPVTTAELMAPFGVSGGGERAQRFLRAITVDSKPWGPVHLGSADLLVSTRREELIALRDRGGDLP
ncbi:MAG: hypothetical protein J2P22_02255 [Nocardioides sp.]|nr:hypothetical protein [Nocardioides sp.]